MRFLTAFYLKDGEDAEKIWQAHNDRMTQKANWLTEQNFKSLHYTSSNGIRLYRRADSGCQMGQRR